MPRNEKNRENSLCAHALRINVEIIDIFQANNSVYLFLYREQSSGSYPRRFNLRSQTTCFSEQHYKNPLYQINKSKEGRD